MVTPAFCKLQDTWKTVSSPVFIPFREKLGAKNHILLSYSPQSREVPSFIIAYLHFPQGKLSPITGKG